jgi:CTP synthase
MIESGLRRAARPGADLAVSWVSPDEIQEDGVLDHLQNADGILGAPGPVQSPDGYIDAVEFAREGSRPYLGCEVGMDLGVVEFARRILTIANAHSTEFEPALRDAVIIELVPPELIKGKPTNIFGEQLVRYTKDARLKDWLQADTSREEHRARYGLNQQYKNQLVRAGLKIAATDETQLVVRALEFTGHPFFVLTSFSPHLRSEKAGPHPILREFLKAVEAGS